MVWWPHFRLPTSTMRKKDVQKVSNFNWRCQRSRDNPGTSKKNLPSKLRYTYGMKKYPNEIFLLCLFTKIRLFVCIFRKFKNVSLLTFLVFDTIWQLLSEKCYNTKWPALDDERLELKRFFKYWLVCLWQAKECFVNKQLTYISKVIAYSFCKNIFLSAGSNEHPQKISSKSELRFLR